MKIGIISDTHDRVDRTARAVSALVCAGAEVLIHCGDVTGPAVVRKCGELPTIFVYGNNDYDHDALNRAVAAIGGRTLGRGGWVELGGRRIAVTHGDLIGEIRRVLGSNPDYFLSGHSHLPSDERRGSRPLDQPRGLAPGQSKWTVAVLDLESDHLEFLDVARRRTGDGLMIGLARLPRITAGRGRFADPCRLGLEWRSTDDAIVPGRR